MRGYERRYYDWRLQFSLTNKELEQIDKQIAAAEIRKAIAEQELNNHELQVENTKAVDTYIREKVTNRELYDWMVGQISGIYFHRATSSPTTSPSAPNEPTGTSWAWASRTSSSSATGTA